VIKNPGTRGIKYMFLEHFMLLCENYVAKNLVVNGRQPMEVGYVSTSKRVE
jgi:hypothetical protein